VLLATREETRNNTSLQEENMKERGLCVTTKDEDKNRRIEDGDMRKILKEMEPYIEATRSQMSMMKGLFWDFSMVLLGTSL